MCVSPTSGKESRLEFMKTTVQLLGVLYSVIQVVWDRLRLDISPSPNATMEKWITPLLSVVGVLLAVGLTWGRSPVISGVSRRVGAVVVLVVLAFFDLYVYLTYIEYVDLTEGVDWNRTRYYIQSVLWASWIAFVGAAFAILADIVWRFSLGD